MNSTALATRPGRWAAGGPAGIQPLCRAEPGAPVWVDLGTAAGTTTAARFYCSLFGWRVVARHRPLEDPVGYWVFQHGDKDVGGLAPAKHATWTVYLAVTDVDAMARAVVDNGGEVLFGPMTLMDSGRMAVCADPQGATFTVWQADPDTEAEANAEANADAMGDTTPTTRYQLACRDVEAAKRFYGSVFGWEARTTSVRGGTTYTEFFCPGFERSVAGMVEVSDHRNDDTSATWMVHFAVTDTDRVATLAAELGGAVSVAPFDMPNVGRIAVIDDPEGAAFSVLQAA
ncbi:MAG: VOC family protein [Acidimicrobiales bacterium]